MSAPQRDEDDLKPTMTEGYNPGQKKALDEYAQLDANDESLAKWKASLGITADTTGTATGKPEVEILELALEVAGRDDVVLDLSKAGQLEELSKKTFTIKEGAKYRMRVKFRVAGDIISGLRYLQLVKRKGIKVDKRDEMMGSYGPTTNAQPYYEKKFAEEEAPSGALYRGTYHVLSRFMDDDQNLYLELKWTFEIKKEW
ncbi:rho guanidine dissociation inhibitor [Ascobolus immersus RN42]|uniref:Rho GDP-dissociation inhibitor n=1 Tax=Ascobolus immersus RN42 TaxID=1160509 RepID=A0A3N4HPL2_ASCIM|nr:rho guanidine dissociation inhibitor [Ascobolus immersus RN42]